MTGPEFSGDLNTRRISEEHQLFVKKTLSLPASCPQILKKRVAVKTALDVYHQKCIRFRFASQTHHLKRTATN